MLREAAIERKKPIAILADLQGPKIRTGALAGGGTVLLRAGQKFVITTAKVLGDSTRVNTTFHPMPREVKRGDRILLSDGLIELRVEGTSHTEVICQVVNGGTPRRAQGDQPAGRAAARAGADGRRTVRTCALRCRTARTTSP